MKLIFLIVLFVSSLSAFANRPSKAISFIPDLCVCQDGVSIQPLNCSNFCAGKDTNGAEILFANLRVSSDISMGVLKNTYGWCNNVLAGDETNPKCVLEVKSKDGSSIHLDIISFSNSLTSNVSILGYDEVFTITLVELASGARSNPIKLVKFSDAH